MTPVRSGGVGVSTPATLKNPKMKKCPVWDCNNGFVPRLRPSKDGHGFSWQERKCPICNGTGQVPEGA